MFLYGGLFVFLTLQEIRGQLQNSTNTTETDPLKVCQLDVEELDVPGNARELSKLCRKLESYFPCYFEHEHEFGPLSGYPFYLKNINLVLLSICDEESILHTEYLSYADCYKELRSDWSQVYGVIYYMVERVTATYRKMSTDKFSGRIDVCIQGQYIQKLIRNLVNDVCGFNAMKFYQSLVDLSQYRYSYCSHADLKRVKLFLLGILEEVISKRILIHELRLSQDGLPKERNTVKNKIYKWVIQVRDLIFYEDLKNRVEL